MHFPSKRQNLSITMVTDFNKRKGFRRKMKAMMEKNIRSTKNHGREATKHKEMDKGRQSKYAKHKFQQVVIQTLHEKGREENSESEMSENDFEIPEETAISLNLSKKNLREFPRVLLSKIQNIQNLYLEGNKLTELPEDFFQNVNSLQWLDLRNNILTSLPTNGLKNHPSLEVILLQGNRIRILPIELATIPSLKGLQTTGNPITNVPYNAIGEGFQGVINYLKKLCQQSEILLPVSDPILVRPSTSRDEPAEKPYVENDRNVEPEPRMWDSEKLSQWRYFMKKKSQTSNSERQNLNDKPTSQQQPKISVSVRSHSKTLSKPIPFRCGVYNRARHRINTSALLYKKLRKTKLGYKRKPITVAMIQEKARKEAHMAQVRETLEKQARKIQRMRDKDVLKSWRDHARLTRQQMKLLDNYQQYPARNFANQTPFDVDPEFLYMLNRVDIYRSLKDYENRLKRSRRPKGKLTSLDLERQMVEIMNKLKNLDVDDNEEVTSPRTKQSHVCNKMSKILDIQKTLKNLQTLNSSMSGIMPILKPKSKN